MFELLKKKKSIIAPVDGKTVELSQVPDKVFAEKMVGDGLAIDTVGSIITAPSDGTLTLIFKTNHAFGMTLKDGVELMVHIGIDTVKLDGAGFERLCKQGDFVKAGTPVIKLDRDFILSKGYSLITPVLITNMDKIKNIEPVINKDVKAGEDIIMEYYL
ncbi:MAG TPA: PTS glucose transporter subunit IIA [Clostridiaceae bacterium]|jgi:PTS system D-glucosamine-specific IIA component/PTS system glucose-specific IIA component|nr:PTS glucose transporter subunit IIA [Clostridiaceae bacterium]HBN28028.1 PTS glucose transporter subunit IIA [Clostridiaceae bacterium]HBX47417.1 PTS glucose transporter subunit IIA [Clostridiaceae bacterium]HCL49787.1 PTS glucose transporter subunit IIA [Clostridiaceae bacterium]